MTYKQTEQYNKLVHACKNAYDKMLQTRDEKTKQAWVKACERADKFAAKYM